MVGEIIVHSDSIHSTAHFHASAHSLELLQRCGSSINVDARVPSCQHRSECILSIVLSQKTPLHCHDFSVALDHRELTEITARFSSDVPSRVALQTCGKALHGRPASHVDDMHDVRI